MNVTEFLEKWGRTLFEGPLARTATLESPPELAEIRFAVLDEVRRHSYRAGARQVLPVRPGPSEHARCGGEAGPQFFAAASSASIWSTKFREICARSGVRFPEQLRVEVEVAHRLAAAGRALADGGRGVAGRSAGLRKTARLLVRHGRSNAPELSLEKPRVHIGREVDVYRNGGMHRRNDLAFVEDCEENRSVSREHAHIDYDTTHGRVPAVQ